MLAEPSRPSPSAASRCRRQRSAGDHRWRRRKRLGFRGIDIIHCHHICPRRPPPKKCVYIYVYIYMLTPPKKIVFHEFMPLVLCVCARQRNVDRQAKKCRQACFRYGKMMHVCVTCVVVWLDSKSSILRHRFFFCKTSRRRLGKGFAHVPGTKGATCDPKIRVPVPILVLSTADLRSQQRGPHPAVLI